MRIKASYIVPHPPIIVPQIGQKETKNVDKTIAHYHDIAQEIAALKPKTIIMITPHQQAYSDVFNVREGIHASGDFKDFGAPDITFEVSVDEAFVQTLKETCEAANIPIISSIDEKTPLDHGIAVPLYFIQQYVKEVSIVTLSLSGLSRQKHYQFGQVIQSVCNETQGDKIILASGDLSHRLKTTGPYGYDEAGVLFDDTVVDYLTKGAFDKLLSVDENLRQKAYECGYFPFLILAGTLDKYHVHPTFYSYEKPFGVGYLITSYKPLKASSERSFLNTTAQKPSQKPHHPYARLAKKALETYLKTGETLKPNKKEKPTTIPGIFVSLKLDETLRGCIGTTERITESLSDAIIYFALEAALRDPRFAPVRLKELPYLSYSVDVLSEPVKIETLQNHDVKKHGLLIKNQSKSGLLLPDIEGIDTAEVQKRMVLKKAGIHPSETYQMYQFTVKRYR